MATIERMWDSSKGVHNLSEKNKTQKINKRDIFQEREVTCYPSHNLLDLHQLPYTQSVASMNNKPQIYLCVLLFLYQSRSVDKQHAVISVNRETQEYILHDLGTLNGVSEKLVAFNLIQFCHCICIHWHWVSVSLQILTNTVKAWWQWRWQWWGQW